MVSSSLCVFCVFGVNVDKRGEGWGYLFFRCVVDQ